MSDKAFTKEELDKAVAEAYKKAKKESGDETEKIPLLDFKEDYVKSWQIGLSDIKNITQTTMGQVADAFTDKKLGENTFIKLLDEQATQLSAQFGVGKGRMEEFRQSIADVSPALIRMGIDQEEAIKNIGKMGEALGSAASLGTEAIVELSAASKATGQDAGVLTAKFREVGISVYDVGDAMLEVANSARAAGVSVSAVSSAVAQNIGKLNLYNFEGGVNGLTKMSIQASRLGVDMGKVFKLADDLMSPEKAIEMSASLQRLGVTSSGLLDPLRAMDMAQNDPEALQKEIVNMSKEFTKFNEQTGKFEIMPGSKRRLREVAEAMGMTAEELAGMSIKASEFDKKMSQIKLPSFAEGNEETKELIASMAQMKDGVATVNVKDEKTGEITLKQVDQLTPEDIEKLKESQTTQAQTVEQLAYDQLTELQQINNSISGTKAAVGFGKATSEPIEKLFTTMMSINKDVALGINKDVTTKSVREPLTELTQPIENAITALLKEDAKGASDAFNQFVANAAKIEEESKVRIQTSFDNTLKSIQETFNKAYNPQTPSQPQTVNVNWTISGDPNITGKINQEQFDKMLTTSTSDPTTKVNVTNNLVDKNAPSATTGGKNQ
jgi:hypothetical protein